MEEMRTRVHTDGTNGFSWFQTSDGTWKISRKLLQSMESLGHGAQDRDPLCEPKAMWEGTSPRVKENKVNTKKETE